MAGKTVILTLSGDTYVPASVVGDISFIANALGGTTTTTTFSITLPATQAGDIIILEFAHRGTGDGTIAGTYTGPAFTLKHSQLFGASAFSGKTYWSRATGNHTGQTVTGSGLTNSCAAIITIYRGALASGDPLADATIVGEQNVSGNVTQAEITTATAKAWVVLVVVNSPDLAVATQACTSPGTLTERAELLSTGGTDASIAHASAVKASAGATGAFTWTQTAAASGSWAYAIKPNITTPFDDARAAMRDGGDSAQAEATGWDAKVKPNIPLANIVRTSDTVCTITLQAQADYDITAQETITWTIPGSILTGGTPIVATPTFTIDTAASGIAGVLTQTLAALTLVSTATVDIAGTSAVTLDALTSAATGTVDLTGDLTQTLGALTLASTAGVEAQGTLAATLDPLTLASTGTVEIAGVLAQTLGDVTLSAESIIGDAPLEGTLTQTLGALTLASTGAVEIQAVADVTLGALLSSGAGGLEVAGSVAATLGDLTLVSAGTLDLAGAVAITLEPVQSVATAGVEIQGTLAVTLAPLTLVAIQSPPWLYGERVRLSVVTATASEFSAVRAVASSLGQVTARVAGSDDVIAVSPSLGQVTARGAGLEDVIAA